MKLLRSLKPGLDLAGGAVATIGNFDGVHLGHQSLLAQLKIKSYAWHLPLVVFLFEPQPVEYFQGSAAPARLSDLREKLDVLAKCQVDYVYCLPFNQQLADMPAEAFAKSFFFSSLQVKYLLVGADFRFGKGRLGDIALLETLAADAGCVIETFPDFVKNEQRVSSTKIRQALSAGDLALAAHLLGRSYSLCGRVISGDGRGRTWGIPTANLAMHRLKLPLTGVFCVQVELPGGDLVYGVANLGKRPSFDGTKNVLEVHLFDFDTDLYGDRLKVNFLHKLRDERKFSSPQALIEQIHQDMADARAACTVLF